MLYKIKYIVIALMLVGCQVIPENEQIMSVIAVGKRSKPAAAPVRKPLEETLIAK